MRERQLTRYLLGAVVADRSSRGSGLLWPAAVDGLSRRSGRTEKNLCRQGSQRNARIPSKRLTAEAAPVMRSAEMRCNSRLPQILQCA